MSFDSRTEPLETRQRETTPAPASWAPEMPRSRGQLPVSPGGRLPDWNGRKEHPVKAGRLAVLAAIVATVVGSEGVKQGWHSPALEVAERMGMPWFVVILGAGLAACGTYTWAIAWKFAKPMSIRRKGRRLLVVSRAAHGLDSPGQNRWRDRSIHAGLQGVSAAAGAAATFLVIPGASGIGEGAIGGALPSIVTEAVFRAVSPGAVVLLIGVAATLLSWWGWGHFGNE